MTHDPLCPMFVSDDDYEDIGYCCRDCDGYGCDCRLIAKIRADEKSKHDECACGVIELDHFINGQRESVVIDGVVYVRENS